MDSASSKTSRRVIALVGIASIAAIVGVLALSDMRNNLVYYLTADELLARERTARGAIVRLGGLVQLHSVKFEPQALALSFRLGSQAEGGRAVQVKSSGAPPQMFSEGTGAVVEGTFDGITFYAERVMVKHSNEYRPPAPGDRPPKAYTTLQEPETK